MGANPAYEAALAALREDTLQCWEDQLTGRTKGLAEDSVVTAESAGLRDFLEGTILPHFAARRKELSNRC